MHIDVGGPTYQIQLGGKWRPFEDHPYCGPTPLNGRTGEPLTSMPAAFWDAINRWAVGGKQLDGERCRVPSWCPTCKGEGDEWRHIGGKHYEIAGPCKTCGGKRIETPTPEPTP